MAEVYGEKPKRFTKAWWPYFWTYYKWHTIICVFISVLIVVGLVQYSKKVSPDLGIVYCTTSYCDQAAWEEMLDNISSVITDINGDDETNITFMPIVFADDDRYLEQKYALNAKYSTSFLEKTNYIYICNKESLESNISIKDEYVAFYTVDKWLKSDIQDENLMYGYKNQSYAVSLKDSDILKNVGIDASDLYVLLKDDLESSSKDEKAFENAIIIANKLLD